MFNEDHTQTEEESYSFDYNGYTVESGNKYGLWYIKAPKQQLPIELRGAFTSREEARFAIDRYKTKKEEPGKRARDHYDRLGLEPTKE